MNRSSRPKSSSMKSSVGFSGPITCQYSCRRHHESLKQTKHFLPLWLYSACAVTLVALDTIIVLTYLLKVFLDEIFCRLHSTSVICIIIITATHTGCNWRGLQPSSLEAAGNTRSTTCQRWQQLLLLIFCIFLYCEQEAKLSLGQPTVLPRSRLSSN